MKRTFKGADRHRAMDALDDAETIKVIAWRHGHRAVKVFKLDGKHWRTTIDVHSDEGWQVGDIEAVEVHEVERIVKVWEPVE